MVFAAVMLPLARMIHAGRIDPETVSGDAFFDALREIARSGEPIEIYVTRVEEEMRLVEHCVEEGEAKSGIVLLFTLLEGEVNTLLRMHLRIRGFSTNDITDALRGTDFETAITRYFKCFGSSEARAQLSSKKILRAHPGAEEVFDYFKNLRDKHLIHDENSLTQGFAGVAVNAVGAQYQVADIIAMSFNAFTIDDVHVTQFRQLVNVTLDWLKHKQEELHNLLGAEYERWTREDLLALPDIKYTVPGSDAVSTKRGAHEG